jgi:hypothetical protein
MAIHISEDVLYHVQALLHADFGQSLIYFIVRKGFNYFRVGK